MLHILEVLDKENPRGAVSISAGRATEETCIASASAAKDVRQRNSQVTVRRGKNSSRTTYRLASGASFRLILRRDSKDPKRG